MCNQHGGDNLHLGATSVSRLTYHIEVHAVRREEDEAAD